MTSGRPATIFPQQSRATNRARLAISVQGAVALHVQLQHTIAARYLLESDNSEDEDDDGE
jgi:hypothetical protein